MLSSFAGQEVCENGQFKFMATMIALESDTFVPKAFASKLRRARSSGKGPVWDHLLTTMKATFVESGGQGIEGRLNEGPAGPSNVANAASAGVTLDLLSDTTNLSGYGTDTTDSTFNSSTFFGCDITNDSSCLFDIFNDTMAHSNNSNSTAMPDQSYWTLCLMLFPVLTVFGNILVVMSVYRERSLRHVTNYFICSLAVADILVAVIVMPPAVYVEVSVFDVIFVQI